MILNSLNGQLRVSPASYPILSAGECEHDEVSGYTPSSTSPLPDSLVVLCFTQRSTVMKAEMMMRRRITVTTVTTTPMMTAVSTPPETEGIGGKQTHFKENGYRLLQALSSANTKYLNEQMLKQESRTHSAIIRQPGMVTC